MYTYLSENDMMGLLGGFQTKIIIALVVVIAVAAGLMYWYFTWSQKEIRTLVGNNAALSVSVEIQKSTIENMIARQKLSKVEMAKLNKEFQKSDEKNKELTKMLAKHRNTIPQIIERKASWYEKLINRGSKNVLKDLEEITNPETYNEKPIDHTTE